MFKLILTSIAVILVVALGLGLYKNYKESFNNTDYTTMQTAYMAYPSGEFVVDPMYTEKKRLNLQNVNQFTGVPVGIFQKGTWNSEFTPDLQWCK